MNQKKGRGSDFTSQLKLQRAIRWEYDSKMDQMMKKQ